MGLKEDPTVECGSEMPFPTVKELFSQLRSSFFATEFQRVEKLLVEHEEHAKEKQRELKNKAESLEKEKDCLFLENLKLNDELKKKQKESDALRMENLEYIDQIKVLNSKVSKNPELEDELKKKRREIDEMKKLNAEYEKREAEFRVYKKHFLDLGDRVLNLEKTGKELVGSDGTPLMNLENKQQKNCDSENSKPPLFGEKGDYRKRTEPKFGEIIQIDDDDDDDDDQKCISTLKRKRSLNEIRKEYNDDNIDSHNQPVASLGPNSSSHSDDENVDEIYKSIIARKKRQKERWGVEMDMLQEFNKDDELCMNAVCALHRQIIQGKLTTLGDHKSRISQLSKLIDGDSHKKPKRTASELNRSDLDDCRRFAIGYPTQLFKIYQNKDDPFFPPSRISCKDRYQPLGFRNLFKDHSFSSRISGMTG
ncbi:hypothetical protein Ccrd_002583 [Cynara cardunculus var. scolymus]|uniref:Uncharacterized protein n=1 Tax=Cynara cardunculus var. scolymus TaxID=59895 RepID=A0A124SCZ5_CYNCS|nr:hypothetical protein Ccrd_002583 [Cynara cardunculus var. scolymus]